MSDSLNEFNKDAEITTNTSIGLTCEHTKFHDFMDKKWSKNNSDDKEAAIHLEVSKLINEFGLDGLMNYDQSKRFAKNSQTISDSFLNILERIMCTLNIPKTIHKKVHKKSDG